MLQDAEDKFLRRYGQAERNLDGPADRPCIDHLKVPVVNPADDFLQVERYLR